MSFLGRTYVHQKDENFKEFLDAIGIPEELKQKVLSSKSSQKLDKNGEEYTLTTDDGVKVKEVTFKSGVQFTETVFEKVTTQTTITVEGDVVTQTRVAPDGRQLVVERRYSGDDLVLVVKSDTGEARRHYKAA